MGVLERLNRLVRANLNDLASRAAGRSVLGEVRGSLRDAKAQLVESRLAERRLAKAYDDLLDESQAWEDRALIALKGNDEPLARKALERKYEVDRRARVVKEELDGQRAYLTDLRRSLEAMEVKLQAVRERARTARTAAERTPAASALPSGNPPPSQPSAELEARAELGTLGGSDLFDSFDEMGDRLARAEAELDALRELGPGSDWGIDDPLAERFRELETRRDLERLKRSSGDLDDLRKRLEDE